MEKITNLLGFQSDTLEMAVLRGGFLKSSGIEHSSNRWVSERVLDSESQIEALRLRLSQREAELEIEQARRRHSEQIQATSEALNRTLLNLAAALTLKVNKDEVVIWAHVPPQFSNILERTALGNSISAIFPAEVSGKFSHYLKEVFSKSERQSVMLQFSTLSHRLVWAVSFVLSGPEEAALMVHDVSHLEQSEFEVVRACERERERIGQDLHDSLGQHLAGLKYLCTSLQQKILHNDPVDPSEIAYMEEQVGQALQQTRRLARGLCIIDLQSNELAPALERLAQRMEKVGVKCHIEAEAVPLKLEENAARQLYCIVQEAIANAIRHGHANEIWIELSMGSGTLRLSVKDNGVGFFKGEGGLDGIGLQIMECRARSIGAILNIDNASDGGGWVECVLRAEKTTDRRNQ